MIIVYHRRPFDFEGKLIYRDFFILSNMLEFLEYAKSPYLVVDRRDVAPTSANGGGYIFSLPYEFSQLTKKTLVKRSYLSVSTFTKENYTFFQDEVDFDIKSKYEELSNW